MVHSPPNPFVKDPTHKNSNDIENVQIFAKQTLQNRLFIGNFQEKRYVNNLQAYRDVVVINNDEHDLIRDVEAVKKRIRDCYPFDHWIGITNPDIVGAPSGYCFWVELPEEVFGSYWYKIKRVKFKENEVLITLKTIRSADSNVSSSTSKSLQASGSFTLSKDNIVEVATERLTWLFTTVITLQNTKETVTFLSVLFVALVTGLINLLQYLGDFTLKLMREVSNMIHVLTPSIIAFINLCAKIVGGFYLLILSMWRTRSPAPVYQSPYVTHGSSNYDTVYFRRALPPPPRRSGGGAVITPLD